ncbi:TolC family protein [Robertkochia sediminum]|uniref:TolC family protein n=1 Tax=Robertkochia sediminum TaxID=2785326 RepID=UPI0019321B01|nr:TolC family protein [Robertkochia sediminum]MBL7473292.1 TolC family protein [Robertkochia sediminum]
MFKLNHYWKQYLACLMITGAITVLQAQEKKPLTLEALMEVSREQSLEAFRSKRRYAYDYWRYQSLKSRLLPQLRIDLDPLTYNRSVIKRYDPENNIDVFRQQQNLSTFASLSLTQNIMATGATVYVNSALERFVNYNLDTELVNYSTSPVNIGLIQPIMAYNDLKWENRTALLEFEKAKKEFIAGQQQINLQVLDLYFDWAMSQTQMDIAKKNLETAERLYSISLKRYDLGAIEKDELLNLELESFQAKTGLTRAIQDLQEARSAIQLYLNFEDIENYEPSLPEFVSTLKIGMDRAEGWLRTANPDMLGAEIQRINAEGELDKAIKENRFDLSLMANFGLNQQAPTLDEAYRDLQDRQMVGVSLSMPLLDWGERRGRIKMARMNKEVQDIEIAQQENEVLRALQLAVNAFNVQYEQVAAALKAREISRQSYEITEKRFLSGQVDLLRLTTSRTTWQTAWVAYVNSLKEYWNNYYKVQQLTLYDFRKDQPLETDFDALLMN